MNPELQLALGWAKLALANQHGAEHRSFRPGCPDCRAREQARRSGSVKSAPSTRPCHLHPEIQPA